jgi:hypothetical protein
VVGYALQAVGHQDICVLLYRCLAEKRKLLEGVKWVESLDGSSKMAIERHFLHDELQQLLQPSLLVEQDLVARHVVQPIAQTNGASIAASGNVPIRNTAHHLLEEERCMIIRRLEQAVHWIFPNG